MRAMVPIGTGEAAEPLRSNLFWNRDRLPVRDSSEDT